MCIQNDIFTIAEHTETGKKFNIFNINYEGCNSIFTISESINIDYNHYLYNGYLKVAEECIKGNLFNHFKGKKYLGLGVVLDIKNNEIYVLYQALYNDFKTYIRPIDMFLSDKSDMYSDGLYPQKKRFKSLGKIDNFI